MWTWWPPGAGEIVGTRTLLRCYRDVLKTAFANSLAPRDSARDVPGAAGITSSSLVRLLRKPLFCR